MKNNYNKKIKENGRIKKLKRIFTSIAIPVMVFSMYMIDVWNINTTNGVSVPAKCTISDDFPSSYKGFVDSLRKSHPNWQIKAVYNHLDWNTAVNSESSGTYSRVQDSAFSDAWKRTEAAGDSSYNAAGFVLASRQAVAYTMDPRNFLNERDIFQFRVVDQNINSDTKTAVNEAMTYTPMKDTNYADTIINAANSTGVSPMFIVSRIRQETGCNIINNKSINGSSGYYNFFNIGAYDHATNSVSYGLELARKKGWNTPEKAIVGGVDWMKNNYIKYGQNTVYFQKFDVVNPGNATMILSMQYMSNISAPASEAKIAYDGLVRSGTLNNAFTFYVPVYDNMPDMASVYPGQAVQEYVDDNTRVYVAEDCTPYLNVRSGAGTGYAVIATLKPGTQMTRIKKSTMSQWDMVRLDDGTTGYVFRDYIKEGQVVTSITLKEKEVSMKLNETHKLEYTISPDNAINKDVEWSSSDDSIVSVSNGTLTAKKGGEVTITVKVKYGNASVTCKVKVLVNVESISMSKDTYTLVKGKSSTIVPTIKPDNASNKDYDITSENDNIVKVDGKKIVGVNEGETNITYTTKDQGKKVTVKVKVITVPQDELLSFDKEKLTVDENNNYVSKIEPGSKAKDVMSKISYNSEKFSLSLINSKGSEIKDDDLVGTGTTINLLTKDTKDVIETYFIVIYGDASGDGKISSMDYTLIKNHIMDVKKIDNGCFSAGADVNGDGKISTMDYTLIKNHIMDVKKIAVR